MVMMRPACIMITLILTTINFLSATGTMKSIQKDSLTMQTLKEGWNNPARTYRPHTRWWWPGNALTEADITFQLEQMAMQGMGGVEIMTAFQMYQKGNAEYLSPRHLELMKFAVFEAKRLDMEVAITFGPGWSFGGPWVKPEEQSKALCLASVEMTGGNPFSGELPQSVTANENGHVESGRLIAVVAAQVVEKDSLDGNSLTVLSGNVKAGTDSLEWNVPEGKWRVMTFWLKPTGQENQAYSGPNPSMVIDHFSESAMRNYCNYLGGIFNNSFGTEFGPTVDSFFCDSFEIMPLPNSILWSDNVISDFEKVFGYDFSKYLPSIWFNIGPQTPRVRYDLGRYLSDLGLKTVFKTFNDWCAQHQVQARIQPHYRFTEELVQGAGAVARPETEATTTRFEPMADPHKATASGARFYGNGFVSAEAYTFIHHDRYRTSLQEMKIATDAFLRDGVTQFYNHGYFASPEMHVAPSRDMPWASRISHWNTWWNYYHCLTSYISRCGYLLRQGQLVADVLIYSPQATEWSKTALYGKNRRVMPYGNLAKTLVANGYDFDIVNDDLLQNRARFHDGKVNINGYTYPIIILPAARVLPIETARVLNKFVKAGGTIIALDELPSASAGLNNAETNDKELKQIVDGIFSGTSTSEFLPGYKIVTPPFVPTRQFPSMPTETLNEHQRKFLASIEKIIPPDFSLAGRVQSNGLTFIHKRINDLDVFFVTNLEPNRIATDVTFRVTGKTPQRWNAISGSTGELVSDFRIDKNGTTIPLDFEPWESAFFIFTPGVSKPKTEKVILELPEPLAISGTWKLTLEGHGFETYNTTVEKLASWTNVPRTKHFSGTGSYEIEFELSAHQMKDRGKMILDLGKVGDIAEVKLNGKEVGVAWMWPYKMEITSFVKKGKNKLVVLVTNQLVNYVSGLKTAPDIPSELQPRLGKADSSIYAKSGIAHIDMSQTHLPPSGLMGPVRIMWE